MISIAVAMAAHNRRATTVRCLGALLSQSVNYDVQVCLFDDGSTDGTSAAVLALGSKVTVIAGDGKSFWAASMARAEAVGLSLNTDHILWLNDDVTLHPDALERLLGAAIAAPGAIIVGAVADPVTGRTTYGGLRRVGRSPAALERVGPTGALAPLDAFNGNVVLVPNLIARKLGGIDANYSHGYADIDYGYRAVHLGVPILQAAEYVGTCPANDRVQPWKDPAAPFREAWASLVSRKNFPPRSQYRFTRRHAGWRFPAYFASPYLRFLAERVRGIQRPTVSRG